jgi:hypothetical protein
MVGILEHSLSQAWVSYNVHGGHYLAVVQVER